MIHIRGKKVLLFGLGLHGGGVATAQWLHKHGALVRVTDMKDKKALAPSLAQLSHYAGITYTLSGHKKQDIAWADIVVVNPGVPRESEYVRLALLKKKIVVNEASLFFDAVPAYTIGVTGTRGKSTTATYLAHILTHHNPRTTLAGNIRTAFMLGVVDRLTNNDIAVLELSSWQLEGLDVVGKSPDIAVVTNLYPDHLNRYTNKEAYYASKKRIFKHQKDQQVLVLNYDDTELRAWKKEAQTSVYFFSQKTHAYSGVYVKNGIVYFRKDKKETTLFPLSRIAVFGSHNRANALAAIAGACVYGVPARTIKKAIRSLPPLPGRQEIVSQTKKVLFVNDTTATTPIAGIAALERFIHEYPKARIHLIAGGADKSLDYAEWARAVKRYVYSVHLLSGDASIKMKKALHTFTRLTSHYTDIGVILQKISTDLRAGDIVLFSPAAASFNLWSHEFERGDAFMRALQKRARVI